MSNKYQEALDVINQSDDEKFIKDSRAYFDKYKINPVSVLQQLVDKETPMKPIVKELKRPDGKGGEEFWQYLYKCPKCEENYNKNGFGHYNSLDKGIPYCAYCGQKLDWSVDNED